MHFLERNQLFGTAFVLTLKAQDVPLEQKSTVIEQVSGVRSNSLQVIRKIVDMSIPLLGMVVIMAAILFLRHIHAQIVVVLVGILLIELGVWQIAQRLLPTRRRFHALRRELDAFMALVRQLNDAALAVKTHGIQHHRQAFDETHDAMKQAVERMVLVAGRTDEESASEGNITEGLKAVDVEK